MSEPMFIPSADTYDFIFDGHAGASPSGADRWMTCTASLQASREFLETLTPAQQQAFASGSSAARQGTTAHAASEVEINLMLGNTTQAEADAALLELAVLPDEAGEAYDEDMARFITEYVDLVKAYAQERNASQVLIEKRVSAVVPLDGLYYGDEYTINGSADCIVLPTKQERSLVVADLKYGNGIDVDVVGNSQARIYALGALALIEPGMVAPTTVVYHIIQPRLGGIKTWEEPVSDLLTWRDEVLSPALTAALHGDDSKFVPSEKACQFCPARGTCVALTNERVEKAAALFDTQVEAEFADGPGAFPEPTSLTDTRLGELLSQIDGLVDIRDDLRAEAQRRLHRGGTVPGYKLVGYTPPRKWKPEAVQKLKSIKALWKDPTLVTPKQALALSKGDEKGITKIEGLIDTPESRPVIAPEHDRRHVWAGTPAEQMFSDLGLADGEDGA